MWSRWITLSFVVGLASCTTPSSPEGPAFVPSTASIQAAKFQICSTLPFNSGVDWSGQLTSTDREALKLSFNISGSYEGETGWVNLTNNFDGQGLSAGLLNQTLGTGSLEPLLIEMKTRYAAFTAATLSSPHFDSMSGMLTAWNASLGILQPFRWIRTLQDGPASRFDRDERPLQLRTSAKSGRNGTAVQWAVKTLYSDGGSTFLPSWKQELTTLMGSDQYVGIQIKAGTNLHDGARQLQDAIHCTELRCYLLMFDFTVQNGGIYQSDLDDYAAYLKAHPRLDLTAQLKKLVELRIRHVIPKYAQDVRSRKYAIIDGVGTVHGINRNLEKQYCFDRHTPYP
jgi:hypothetical protein